MPSKNSLEFFARNIQIVDFEQTKKEAEAVAAPKSETDLNKPLGDQFFNDDDEKDSCEMAKPARDIYKTMLLHSNTDYNANRRLDDKATSIKNLLKHNSISLYLNNRRSLETDDRVAGLLLTLDKYQKFSLPKNDYLLDQQVLDTVVVQTKALSSDETEMQLLAEHVEYVTAQLQTRIRLLKRIENCIKQLKRTYSAGLPPLAFKRSLSHKNISKLNVSDSGTKFDRSKVLKRLVAQYNTSVLHSNKRLNSHDKTGSIARRAKQNAINHFIDKENSNERIVSPLHLMQNKANANLDVGQFQLSEVPLSRLNKFDYFQNIKSCSMEFRFQDLNARDLVSSRLNSDNSKSDSNIHQDCIVCNSV